MWFQGRRHLQTLQLSILAAFLLLLFGISSLGARQTHSNHNTANRIDHTGRLRMLSQRLVQGAVLVRNDAFSQKAYAQLGKSKSRFSATLAGLKNGSLGLDLEPATDAELLQAIVVVEEGWHYLEPLLDAPPRGSEVKSEIEQLTAAGDRLLESCQQLMVTERNQLMAGQAEMSRIFSGSIIGLLILGGVTLWLWRRERNLFAAEEAAQKTVSLLDLVRENESRYRAILASAVDPLITVDGKGIVQTASDSVEPVFGWKPEELIGKNVNLLMPEPIHSEHDGYLSRFRETGISSFLGETRELEAVRRDGNVFPCAVTLWQADVPRGAEPLFIGSIRDITELKRAEEDVRRFRAALDSSADSLFLIDHKAMRFVDLNETACISLGYSREELLALGPQHIKPEMTKEELSRRFVEIILSPRRKSMIETIHRRKDGSIFPVEIFIESFDAGDSPLLVASARDVTERKEVEAELSRERKRAEQANRSKSEFLANMSHEIRTPMTAILGFADVLQVNVMDEESIEAVKTIKRNGSYLIDIINDILDISKIEAGKLEVEKIEFSPAKIVAEVASLMRVRADAKGLKLDVEYVGSIPASVHSDPTRLRQILINLVGNAIKFTELGHVKLVARLLVSDGTEPCLRFDVIDSGVGMTNEQVAGLFKPFTQVDASTTRKFGGTGLGLTISIRLARMLGGNITVSSAPDSGSTFSATVGTGSLEGVRMLESPGEAAEVSLKKDPAAALSEKKLDCHVLLVEDGPDNQKLISFLLKKAGARITLAENGQVAVESVATALKKAEPFDVILMDMQMPVLDGYQATRQLRGEGYHRPIIALTANAMSSDRAKCLEAGCDDYLTKPINAIKLVDAVKRFSEQATEDAPRFD